MISLVGAPGSIRRKASVAAAALVALATGISFTIRGGTGTTTYIDKRWTVVTCTNTGGLAKYPYCNWQEPSDNAGSGSYISAIYYTVGKSPVVIGLDFTIGKSATLSGATQVPYMQNIQSSSGAVFLPVGFGYKGTFGLGTGALMITEGDYLRGVTLTNPTSAHTASMYIEYVTRLSK